VAADPIAKKVSKAFCRNHPSSPKYFDMWDAQLILDFYRNSKPPRDVKERAKYIWQRAAVLVLFFGILRIKELVTLDWRRVQQVEDGLILQVVTKSDNDRYAPVFLPKLEVENSAICPVAALRALAISALAVTSEIGMIFTDYLRDRVLSRYTIAAAIKEILVKIGIDTEVYGPYTVKHAVISALVKDGIPLAEIGAAAHYKSADTLQFYAYKEIMKRIGLSLARIVQRIKITEFVDPSKGENVKKFREVEASKYEEILEDIEKEKKKDKRKETDRVDEEMKGKRDRKGKAIKPKDYSEYTDSEEEGKEEESEEVKDAGYNSRKRVTTEEDNEKDLLSQFKDNQWEMIPPDNFSNQEPVLFGGTFEEWKVAKSSGRIRMVVAPTSDPK
jgi:hypothetical protein